MRVLVVGAGAVGQVYGYHLQAGGAQVTFLVKPRHAAEARAGFTLLRLRRFGGPRVLPFRGFDVLEAPEQVSGRRFDQVWLAVSSTGLRGPWLDELLPRLGEAALVSLQPGLDDARLLLARWPAERLVRGVIALIAYQAPLPGEALPASGIAFWRPPLSRLPFDGPPALAAAVADAMSRGGFPAAVVPGAPERTAHGSAVLMPTLAALEAEGWSFARLRRSPLLARACDAAAEGMALVEAELGVPRPAWARLVRPALLRLLTRVAPLALPLPVETYLRHHFTKVGDQTRLMLRTYVERARTHGLEADALAALVPPDP